MAGPRGTIRRSGTPRQCDGGLGHAEIPRQPGLGQLLPVLGHGEPEEALDGMQIRHLAHAALQVGATGLGPPSGKRHR